MKKKICSTLLLILIVCALAPTITANAANAKKVTSKSYIKNGKEYMIVKGKTSKGKVCWTYKTPKYSVAELTYFGRKVKNNRVYIFEKKRITVLKLSNGKKIWRKKTKCIGAPVYAFDSKSNLYLASYADPYIEKFSKSGKLKWRSNIFNTKNYMINKLVYKNGKIKITCAGDNKSGDIMDSWVILDAATGKVLNYKNK